MPFCIITNKTLCCDFSNRKYENRQAHFAPRETGTWVTASLGVFRQGNQTLFLKKKGEVIGGKKMENMANFMQ